MISTYAGSSRTRSSRSVVSAATRRIVAAAALGVVLGQPQQGEPGLRLGPATARVAVGRLGTDELTLEPMQLGLPVERLSGRLAHRQVRPPARPPCLPQGVAPRAVELHDLGAVDQAAAGEGDHVGLLVAPLGQGRGPLLRAAQRVCARQPSITLHT